MKKIILFVVYCLLLNVVFAQSDDMLIVSGDITCTADVNHDIIIIDTDAVFQADTYVIQARELIVRGKFISGTGEVMCEKLTIDGGTWESLAEKTISVGSDFVANNASIDGAATPQFTVGGNMIFEGASSIGNCALNIAGNCIINGNVELQLQRGVKKVMGDMLIAGVLNNSANERIEIFGNMTCNGSIEQGNFTLHGNDKEIHGTIEANTLNIAGCYTNYGTVEVKQTFSGSGTYIQAENALLITHAPSSPTLVASAVGNTVRCVRNAALTIQCAEFYNLECSTTYNLTKDFPEFSLAQNTKITGSLRFTRNCYLNLQDFALIFPKWTETSIQQENIETGGIILHGGTIEIDTVEPNQAVHIPLYHSNMFSDFAHVTFTNNDDESTNFSLTRLHNYITNNSATDGEILDNSPYISAMYDIVSRNKNSTLSLYWHTQKESPCFDRNNCRVVSFNENTWESFGENAQTQQTTHENIYSVTTQYTNTTDGFFTCGIQSENLFLPVRLNTFTASTQLNHVKLTWETASEHDCDYFMLLKSYDGRSFFPRAHIAGNGTSSIAHSYSFDDYEQMFDITYYQLEQYDYNGSVWESDIISTRAPYSKTIFERNNTQCIIKTTVKDHCYVSNSNGKIIDTFETNSLYDFSHLVPGIYFVNMVYT
ncbi:MAG: hypothetical protein LBR55_05875, partial [Bacteroidales bacterium]|nr:hypothetical protein [Bacteroidales bacterium]